MSETLEERKARIMVHLQKEGQGSFNDFVVAPKVNYSYEMWEAWKALLDEERIEYVPGSPPNIYVARFRVRAQMRLL